MLIQVRVRRLRRSLFCIVVFMFLNSGAQGTDVIRISQGQSSKDVRTQYTYEILDTAMSLTTSSHGEYRIEIVSSGIPNKRVIDQLRQEDGFFNVAMAITREEWEASAIPIRIPLRMGLLNYRLLAVHKDDLALFENITSVDELRALSVGLRKSWATWLVMSHEGYNVVNAYTYDSLFSMLEKQRFNYIPRGVHEIYDELELRKDEHPNLVVEPNLALYIPAPYYVFVAPHEPRLAERLTLGLQKMVAQGRIKSMINRYYTRYIEQADLKNRTILHVGNPLLPENTPLDNDDYWMDFVNYSTSDSIEPNH